MKIMHYYSKAMALLTAAFLVGTAQSPANVVSNRKTQEINTHYTTPWPATNAAPTDAETEFLGKAGWALSAYYLSSNVPTANTFIKVLNSTNYLMIPNNGNFDGITGEFAFPLLIRIAMGNDINGVRMTNAMGLPARTNLFDMIWKIINHRSKVADAGNALSNVRGILGSENHNETWRSVLFLGAQVLNSAGAPYGPGGTRNTLVDGNTLAQHYNAWRDYWLEYYRQRAREGLDIEVNSPTYQKYTVQSIYNVMDFGGTGADRATMQTQAKNYLTLYWADAANEFSPGSGGRGGAGCRMYQDNHLTDGNSDSLLQWYYMNDWEDTFTGTGHPGILTAAMSSYEIPGTIAAIATNNTKGYYEYNSHRLSAGTDDTYADTDFYHLAVPGQVRRDTTWAPEFVIGSATYDSTQSYTGDGAENHFCGVVFGSDITNRLVVQGIGTAKTGTADKNGVTSASNQQSLIAALGKDATNNAGMRVFVSNLLYNNLVTNGNWLLTFAKNGYVGIRIATGGYTWGTKNNDGTTCTDGKFLDLTDKWSPLVIQCARAADYSSVYGDFTNAVVSTYYNYDSVNGVLTYTNLLGQQFKMWRNSDNLPWVGPGTREENPTYTYKSPYISASTYGGATSRITNSYPGLTNVVLDFDY